MKWKSGFPMYSGKPIGSKVVTFGANSAGSTLFSLTGIQLEVWVDSDVDCYVKYNESGTKGVTSEDYHFKIYGGVQNIPHPVNEMKVGEVIAADIAGTLHITELL